MYDTSGSMLARLTRRQRRIDVAKSVLDRLITRTLPPGVPTSLRIFRPLIEVVSTASVDPPPSRAAARIIVPAAPANSTRLTVS